MPAVEERRFLPHWLAPRRAAGALLFLYIAAGAWSASLESATFDETAHLPAGLSYWHRGDFRMNPEHPPIAKQWAALPGWILGLGEPNYESTAWVGARPLEDGSRTDANEWIFGFETLNGRVRSEARRDPRPLLLSGRLAMLTVGLLLGWSVFRWSSQIWGPEGGLISLSLFALSPTMLAHGRLVTTDLPTALGFTATIWAWTCWARQPSRGRLILAALALGGALSIKFSAVLLLPVAAAAGVLAIAWASPGAARRRRFRQVAWSAPAAIAIVWFVIWAVYRFRFDAAPGYRLDWSIIGTGSDSVRAADADAPGWLLRALSLRLLPEAYLYGLAYVLGGAARRLAYLNGEQSVVGWWFYFPEAFLLKTPLPTLALTAWAAVEAIARRAWRRRALWLAAGAAGLYALVSIGSSLNIGHRHLAPLYPLLFVALGGLVRLAVGWRKRLLVGLMASATVAFAIATPAYLSYFNLLSGGPRGGSRYLLDSNLDWGQDLPRLGRWMQREGVDEVWLAYFGTADPRVHGVRFRKLRMAHDFYPDVPGGRPVSGDLVAVSLNMLHGLYVDTDGDVASAVTRRRWVSGEVIQEWVRLRDQRSLSGRPHPSLLDWLVEAGHLPASRVPAVEAGLLGVYLERLRTAGPIARPAPSIHVFRAP